MKFKLLLLFTLLGLLLRIYQLGFNDFKEEENTTVKAGAYQYYCIQDKNNCQQPLHRQNNTFSSKLITLLTNNETKPNLITANYLWDWVKDKPTQTHYSRAWPHLLSLSAIYSFFDISPFSSRIISVIAGTLLIPFGFIFARYFTGSTMLSLIYSFLLTIGFQLIDISRYVRMYSSFILIFLLAVYFIYRALEIKLNKLKNFLLTGLFFAWAYFLQLLALLLPVSVYFYSLYFGFIKKEKKYQKIFYFLSLIIISLVFAKIKLNIDFFHTYFSSLSITLNWKYLKFLFNYPLPAIASLGLIIFSLSHFFNNKKITYLSIIIIINLIYLIFFSKMTPASAYVIHLVPISLLLLLISINNLFKSELKTFVFTALILFSLSQWLLRFNYLYLGKNGQPKISQAYQIIFNNFQSGDQILGIQIRDYYLKNLPNQTQVINLPEKKSLEQIDFLKLVNQSKNSFILWENEKEVHLKPEIIDYIQTNFTKLAGEGIDSHQIEIYATFKDRP